MGNQSIPVEVEIIVPDDLPKSGEASLHVFVEDVSYADARAQAVAEKVINTRVEPGKHLFVTVDVPVNAVSPQQSYNVRAHVSMNNTNAIQAGDLITTQSFPVLTQARQSRVVLPLRQVK